MITQRLRWKLPDGLIFLHHFQHLSLYSNQLTPNLDKLYTRSFRMNHAIYWWKPHENPCSSFRVYREQTDRQTDRQTRRRTLFYNMYRLEIESQTTWAMFSAILSAALTTFYSHVLIVTPGQSKSSSRERMKANMHQPENEPYWHACSKVLTWQLHHRNHFHQS